MVDARPIAFVCYAHEDLAFVQTAIAPLCERRGYAPWWDTKGITGGEDFERRIVEQLRVSSVFLLLMSPDSQASQWVRDELHVAFHLGRTVIPVLYRECDPLEFHIRLPRMQLVDVRESADALSNALKAAADPEHGMPEDTLRDPATEFATIAITLLPWPELNHLRNLSRATTAGYRGGRSVRHEVRHLCDLGLCARKEGRRIGELEQGRVVDLAEIVELTAVGRDLSKYIR